MRTQSACLIAFTSAALALPAAAQSPTMEPLWPNDDGRSWRYAQHHESYGPGAQVIDNELRVFFDGTTVAGGGIGTQYLRQEVVGVPVVNAVPGGAALAAMPPDPLLRAIWVARPDLRVRIEQAIADAPCPAYHPVGGYAVLLGGEFAWRRTTDEVAAWRCNAENTRSWLWLVSDLTIGNTFTLQLLPDLASDVFLRGTIAAIEPSTVPAGAFDGCVRVDYVVDYGVGTCTDPSGNPIGMSRSETRGYVRYAPNIGPVESYEQFIPEVEGTGTCGWPVGEPLATTTMRLGTLPVPTRSASWGTLKTAYR
jgi:hypothetical protein